MVGKEIVECVPNFSEGRDSKVIESISAAIRSVPGVRLLDVDPGASTNRTVYTFVGCPAVIVEGALAAARAAHRSIDMTKHSGSHPRMGALDVCPFIPVCGVTVEDCVRLSRDFGRRLAEELSVPVFLYGEAAVKGEYRETLPQIRAGEYEGLQEKLRDRKWAPDFGAAQFVPRWGATVTGVRKFLIAYNINLLSTKEQAHRIALNLRSQGRNPSDPGRLSHCQGMGWYLEERNLAQISLNLTDYEVTPIHVAFEEASKDALELKLPVLGSEVVGLVPLKALLQAADFYIDREKLFLLEEEQKVQLAINRLGLSQLSPFVPEERIIEYCLEDRRTRGLGPLAKDSLASFVRSVGARTPAPGGGSVAASVAAMGAALGAMVGQLTYGKRQWEHLDFWMRTIIPPLHEASNCLLPLVDRDATAFTEYMEACKSPKDSVVDKWKRKEDLHRTAGATVEVPLEVMRIVDTTWSPLSKMAEVGNINCKSDVLVGAKCLEAGSYGAYQNVLINLDNIAEEEQRSLYRKEAEELLAKAIRGAKEVLEAVNDRA